jgi:hypothetical protein
MTIKANTPNEYRPGTDVAEVRQTHPYGYRSGEWAKALTIVESYGRDCWLVEFSDGARDWWPIDDPMAGYETRATPPTSKEERSSGDGGETDRSTGPEGRTHGT